MRTNRGWMLVVAAVVAVAACGGKEATDAGGSTASGSPSSGSSSSSTSSSASSTGGGAVCEGCYDEPGTGCPVCPGEGEHCDGTTLTQCTPPFVCGKDNTCITGCVEKAMCSGTEYCSCIAGGFPAGDPEAGPMGCRSGQCAPQKLAGAPCTLDGVSAIVESNDCASTLHCAPDTRVCIPPAQAGGACLVDTDCASANCECGGGSQLNCTCS